MMINSYHNNHLHDVNLSNLARVIALYYYMLVVQFQAELTVCHAVCCPFIYLYIPFIFTQVAYHLWYNLW